MSRTLKYKRFAVIESVFCTFATRTKLCKNKLITLMTVRLAVYRMWVISYAKQRSRHVLDEFLTINHQTLLLAQITYCVNNAK